MLKTIALLGLGAAVLVVIYSVAPLGSFTPIGLLLAGVTAIPTVTGGLDSGIRCPTLGERRSSDLVGHVILLPIRAEGNGLG